jgi:transglutaminase-like putative cysteine protease
MTRQRWSLVFLLCAVAIFSPVVASPLACQIVDIEPYEVRVARPYIEKIVVNHTELRELASAVVQGYLDKEGKINAIYRYIVENFRYIADPEHMEVIRTPFETLDLKGGDCEDRRFWLVLCWKI